MAGFNIRKIQSKKITISNKAAKPLPLSQSRIKSCIQETFKLLKRAEGYPKRPIAVIFLSDEKIKALNKKYLKHNTPTDVLVFDYGAQEAELAISIDTAKRNAKIYNTSLKKETMLYIIHGLLHLCGYNDTTVAARKKMLRKQEWLFSKLKRLS